MLETHDLRKVYPTGDEALTSISTTIEGKEFVAMIGPSGAGKSTFVRCINRLTEPTSGTVELDGTDLTALRDARRNIGMIFQEYNLVERLTVMENVLSGRLGYVSNWAAFRRKFPRRISNSPTRSSNWSASAEWRTNASTNSLAGSASASASLVQSSPKILADEPTSSLDPETSHDVMELLTDIATDHDIPVLINIHEVDLAVGYADRLGLRRRACLRRDTRGAY